MMSDRWLKPGLLIVVPLIIFGIIFMSRGATPSVLSAWLSPDIPAQISFPLGTASQIYSFSGNPGTSTLLTLNSPDPSVSFTAEVRSGNGQQVATLGDGLQNAVLTLGPSDSLYEVEFKPGDGGMPGIVSLMVSDSWSVVAPAATSLPPPDGCSLSSATDGGVNIRGGPSFDYTVLAVLPAGQFLTPDARTEDSWYRVHFGDQIGWIQGGMVTLHGPCGDLLMQTPVPYLFSVTPMPIAISTAVPCTARTTSSLYVNIRNGPGLNYSVIGSLLPGSPLPVNGRSDSNWYSVSGQQGWVSGSVVILEGACDTLSVPPTVLPVAPLDSVTFPLVADRDGSGQINEVISYPDGDRADLIEVSVANLYFQPPDNYREFSVSLVCTGAGSEQVRWGAPENPVLACGSAITIPFLYDYNHQLFTVILPDGSQPGYVSYTLAAVASH